MNYFRCKVCGKLNDLDSDYCDIYHMWAHRAEKENFKWWLERNLPLFDYLEEHYNGTED